MDELMKNQLSNVDPNHYLHYMDKLRYRNKIKTNPFDINKCCWYYGYVRRTKLTNYYSVHIYYNKHKPLLKRLLYRNYIGSLNSNDKVTNICNNIFCVNIRHLIIQNKNY